MDDSGLIGWMETSDTGADVLLPVPTAVQSFPTSIANNVQGVLIRKGRLGKAFEVLDRFFGYPLAPPSIQIYQEDTCVEIIFHSRYFLDRGVVPLQHSIYGNIQRRGYCQAAEVRLPQRLEII
jgi:hypothetical protein